MRGGKTSLPKVTVLTEQELLQRFEASAELSEEDERQEGLWNAGLSLFSLSPPGFSASESREALVSEIAAVYFLEEKDIVVVDRGQPLDTEEAVETLAHEMVHALQDQEYDLKRYQEERVTGLDSALALDALIEGEALLYQVRIGLRLYGVSVDDVDWQMFFADLQRDMLVAADEHGAPVAMASNHFPYAFGGGFVMQHWLAGGRAAVDALFEEPPLTTREVLFGAPKIDLADERATLRPRAVPVLDGEYEQKGATELGAWIVRVFAGRQGLPFAARLDTAKVLAADVFSVQYEPAKDRVVAAWRVRTDTREAAEAWPGMNRFASQRQVDEEQPETALLASEGTPLDLESLAWRSESESESDGEERARASLRPMLPPFHGRATACAVRHPTPWSREDADP